MYKARLGLGVDVCLVGCRMERALLGSVEAVALFGLVREGSIASALAKVGSVVTRCQSEKANNAESLHSRWDIWSFNKKCLSQTPSDRKTLPQRPILEKQEPASERKRSMSCIRSPTSLNSPRNTVDHSSMSPLLISQSAKCSSPLSILLLLKNRLHSLPNLLLLPHLLLLLPPLLRSIHDPAKRPLPITILRLPIPHNRRTRIDFLVSSQSN
jgi:hypothetical protein